MLRLVTDEVKICGLPRCQAHSSKESLLQHVQFTIREYVPIETGEISSGQGRLQEIYFCEENFDGLQGHTSQCAREERSGRL